MNLEERDEATKTAAVSTSVLCMQHWVNGLGVWGQWEKQLFRVGADEQRCSSLWEEQVEAAEMTHSGFVPHQLSATVAITWNQILHLLARHILREEEVALRWESALLSVIFLANGVPTHGF